MDRLLASPHYGERWGRWWLDAARYADSDGYEKDKPRFVWFYRDWVVNALNRDLPYDQFIIDQLAGDLLPNATQDEVVATGFLRNSMINEEGGVDPEQFRMDAMFDRMDAVGKGVLGLTIQCAQCHDHKFDPLTQKEYYRLFAFLNNDYEANVTVYTPEEQKKRDEVLKKVREVEDEPEEAGARLARAHGGVGGEGEGGAAGMGGGAAGSRGRVDRRAEVPAAGGRLVPGPGLRADQAHRPDEGEDGREERHGLPHGIAQRPEPAARRARAGRSTARRRLSEFAVEAEVGGKTEKLKFAKATADYNPPEAPLDPIYDDKSGKKRLIGPASFAIDGNDDTAWATDADPGRRNVPHEIVFTLDKPLANPDGDDADLPDQAERRRLEQRRQPEPQPRPLPPVADDATPGAEADPVPAAVRQILALPRGQADAGAGRRRVRLLAHHRRGVGRRQQAHGGSVEGASRGFDAAGAGAARPAARHAPAQARQLPQAGRRRRSGRAGVPNPLPAGAPPTG